MAKVQFVCKECRRSEPVETEKGKIKEWAFCCGKAMSMGVVIGKLAAKAKKGK